jgi:PAS domain S-box-containing protein
MKTVKNKKDTKESLAELRQRYQLLRELMDQIPDVIYFKDRKARLVMVNQAHAKGLGLRPEEVVGKTDFDFFPRERAQQMFDDDMSVIKTGRPIVDKIERATRPDGVDNYVSTTKIPRYDEKGRVIGIVGITRDITHRMQLENLIREQAHAAKKIGALEELSKLKSEFVSVVSHELRTPLAIIREAVSLIKEGIAGNLNEKQKEMLSKAMKNIERLNNIISTLLDASRIEAGKTKLHYSLVNLNDLLKDSSAYFRNLAHGKGLRLNYRIPRSQINIFLDVDRISQVISNLINNAIKYTEENGRIIVEVVILETKVRIGVIDTGIGIAAQDLPKLFKKFTQVSGVSGAEKHGLGLGLSIAKDLIELHGGEIWVESKIGIGSKFYFTIPRFYTRMHLGGEIREKINRLLSEKDVLFIVNIIMVHFREFHKKRRIISTRFFRELKNIITSATKEFISRQKDRSGLILQDSKYGEYSVVFTDVSEKMVEKACDKMKEEIFAYFKTNDIKDIFINIGVLSFADRDTLIPKGEQVLNIAFKKIFVGSNIRRYARIEYRTEIEIFRSDQESELTQSIDISEGGICFGTDFRLETDRIVRVRFKLAPSAQILDVKGRIAWLKEMAEDIKETNKKYKVGLEFARLAKKEKIAIRRFINSVSVR